MPKKEEITDVLTPGGYERLKVGQVLVFEKDGATTQLKVVKKSKGRVWVERMELVDMQTGMSHYGHNIDTTDSALKEFGVPFCQDCQLPVREVATEAGDLLAHMRAKQEDTK